MIYDVFKKNIINEFKFERDRLVAENKFKNDNPCLFQIDDNLELYNSIIGMFNIICEFNVIDLVGTLCEKYNLEFTYGDGVFDGYIFDCSINLNEKFFIKFIQNTNVLNQPLLKKIGQDINECETSTLIVFLVKNRGFTRIMRDMFLKWIKEYIDKDINVQCLTFEAFLFNVFGEKELIDFQSSMSTLKRRFDLNLVIN